MPTSGEPGKLLDHLLFRDYVAAREYQSPEWITAGAIWDLEGDEHWGTVSALVPHEEGTISGILATHTWDGDPDGLGRPELNRSGDDESLEFDPGDVVHVGTIPFRPFAIARFHPNTRDWIDIEQTFHLWWNLYPSPDHLSYYHLDDAGEQHEVLRYSSDKCKVAVEVAARFLRDYLCLRGMALVRYHDHRRWVDVAPEGVPSDGYTSREGDHHYHVDVAGDSAGLASRAFSVFLGKDVVRPYPKPLTARVWWDRPREYVDFVYGLDDNGNEVEATCDEHQLSNYFSDRGTPHFLTAVYFRREVLATYYAEPSKYDVSPDCVRCLDRWSIPIDTNSEGLVQVWLGDLGRLPVAQQRLWRSHNVAPRGGVTEERLRRDLAAQFVECRDPIYQFRVQLDRLNQVAVAATGEPLLKPLRSGDRHCLSALHVPLTDEQQEFDSQVQALAKICVDSLNVAALKQLAGLSTEGGAIERSLNLLSAWVKPIGGNDALAACVQPLRDLQALRSRSAAHRKGPDFPEFLTKLGLGSQPLPHAFRTMVDSVTGALTGLADLLGGRGTEAQAPPAPG